MGLAARVVSVSRESGGRDLLGGRDSGSWLSCRFQFSTGFDDAAIHASSSSVEQIDRYWLSVPVHI